MLTNKFCLVLCVLMSIFSLGDCSASGVSFQASSLNIDPISTNVLQLRCAVDISRNASLFPVGGRKIIDVSHVTSITISKFNQMTGQFVTLASETSYDPHPIVGQGLDGAIVEGDTETSLVPGERGHLRLTWERPTMQQAGVYTCDISALDSGNQPATLTHTVQITASEPSVSNLVDFIVQLEAVVRRQNETLEMFKIGTESDIFSLRSEDNHFRAEISRLESLIRTNSSRNG